MKGLQRLPVLVAVALTISLVGWTAFRASDGLLDDFRALGAPPASFADEDGVPVRPRGRGLEAAEIQRVQEAALPTAGDWIGSLAALEKARKSDPAASTLDLLDAAFRQALKPVARQNLIFQVALTVPPTDAGPWLERVLESADAQDQEDAIAALAFGGNRAAIDAFREWARAPAEGFVPPAVDDLRGHEALGRRNTTKARVALRAYRALEVFRRRPYFHRTLTYVSPSWGKRPPLDGLLVNDLAGAWLSRWPGHPGSDDMAILAARHHVRRAHYVDAARWYSKATLLPDRDKGREARQGLLACLEIFLDLDPLRVLTVEAENLGANTLLHDLAWLRRLAVERGCGAAVTEAASIAARYPESRVGLAWVAREREPPPRGLASGRLPLDDHDPLLRRAPPSQDATQADLTHLARVFRAWEAMATLEQRALGAPAALRADLLYKRAAIPFHDDAVFFPPYLRRKAERIDVELGIETLSPRLPEGRWHQCFADFERGAHGEIHAVVGFEQVIQEFPQDDLAERAAFSIGQAYRRLIAQHPSRGLRRDAIRRTVTAFDRFLEAYPESRLRKSAQSARAYWERIRTFQTP